MVRIFLLGSTLLLASCATTPTRNAEIESAVRWGVDACERHLIEGVPLKDALAQSADGRGFALDTRNIDYWYGGGDPYRLDGLSIYVGADDSDPQERECRLMALGAGTPALRDALIDERVAQTGRAWTDATRNPRGLRAACTVDRVPEGQSVLLTAEIQIWPRVDTASIPNDPFFQVILEMQATCDRDPGYWM